MLSGRIVNCYGIRELELPEIDFTRSNRAIIYAPNGVMKTSLSRVFEDISKGKPTKDRIFPDSATSYSVQYYASNYSYPPASAQTKHQGTDQIYVVNSFDETFEFTKETVSTLLADEATRHEYSTLISEFSNEIRQVEERIRAITGLTKPKVKGTIVADLELLPTADWPDIFERINELMAQYHEQAFLNEISYMDLFNSKALEIYRDTDFRNSISEYIGQLNSLLSNNPILSDHFTDRSAEALGKAFTTNNLFEAHHRVQLRDGSIISTLKEWNDTVSEQLNKLYQTPELSDAFTKLKKLLTSNNEGHKVREIIMRHRELIPFLLDIASLKTQVWLNVFNRLDKPFGEYYTKISAFTIRVRSLYEKASQQSARWQQVVSEFNRRFRVPFKVKMNNKANFLLKDEAPNLSFIYSRGTGETQQLADLTKDALIESLSMGEKRALYLLYILFDLERIRRQAESGNGKFLIIADDIADSFDYKNKYAIIEYLNDLANSNGIDLLILTHNFDFYRTIQLRIDVKRPNCFIAQKGLDDVIKVSVFKYQNDFFKKVIIEQIHSGRIDTDDKIKRLIASIPFYRNLCEYSGDEINYLNLTCFLHLKTIPIDTNSASLLDLWSIISCYMAASGEIPVDNLIDYLRERFKEANDNTIGYSNLLSHINTYRGNAAFIGTNEKYTVALNRIADDIAAETTDEVSLENKLVLSIAIRLKAEVFLKRKIIENGQACPDSERNQTRDWYIKASAFMSDEERDIIDNINLITPENIHLNAFMYEPLMDISNWALKELYQRVSEISD